MRFRFLLAFACLVTLLVFVTLQLLLQTKTTPVVVLPSDKQDNPAVSPSLPLGRHFMIGHWANTPGASTTDLIKKYQLAGVIIMSAPADATDIKTWTTEWQNAVDYPLMIAIDQEGGEVSRLRGGRFNTTAQRDITTEQEAYAVGLQRGQELAALGINMNFAPVLDTAQKPTSFLYNRVFPKNEVALAAAFTRGHNEAGVDAVVKHFPGHPDTPHDSHLTLPEVLVGPDNKNDFISPFKTYLQSTQPTAVMAAHVSFPHLDPLPATLSKYWLTTVLRDELNYEGLIITDDMSMKAISETWQPAKASQLALTAGADIILLAAEPKTITTILNDSEKEWVKIPGSEKRLRRYANE